MENKLNGVKHPKLIMAIDRRKQLTENLTVLHLEGGRKHYVSRDCSRDVMSDDFTPEEWFIIMHDAGIFDKLKLCISLERPSVWWLVLGLCSMASLFFAPNDDLAAALIFVSAAAVTYWGFGVKHHSGTIGGGK